MSRSGERNWRAFRDEYWHGIHRVMHGEKRPLTGAAERKSGCGVLIDRIVHKCCRCNASYFWAVTPPRRFPVACLQLTRHPLPLQAPLQLPRTLGFLPFFATLHALPFYQDRVIVSASATRVSHRGRRLCHFPRLAVLVPWIRAAHRLS